MGCVGTMAVFLAARLLNDFKRKGVARVKKRLWRVRFGLCSHCVTPELVQRNRLDRWSETY